MKLFHLFIINSFFLLLIHLFINSFLLLLIQFFIIERFYKKI